MTDFAKVANALWGASWRLMAQVELETDDRTVRRWYQGHREVPKGVWVELAAKIGTRSLLLREAYDTALDNVPICSRRMVRDMDPSEEYPDGREGLDRWPLGAD